MSRDFIPDVRYTTPAVARAARAGDADLLRSVRRDHAAARINTAIDRALTSAGAPLKTEHAEALAARLRGAAR